MPSTLQYCSAASRGKNNAPSVAILLAMLLFWLLSSCGTDAGGAERAPALGNVDQTQMWIVDRRIDPLFMPNRGSAPSQCSLKEGQSLPMGLSLGIMGNSCAISGMPSQRQGEQTYTITADNNAGSSSATVTIEIIAAPASACADDSPASQRSTNYRLRLAAEWSVANNGGSIPPGAGFSSLLGLSHSDDFTLWSLGTRVTSGFETLAEESMVAALRMELEQQKAMPDNDLVDTIFASAALPSATGALNITFTVNCAFPLVSAVARLEPSPDWFVGLSRHSLLDGDQNWLSRSRVDLFVYDAGTENGDRFVTTGSNSNPQVAVSRLVGNQVIGFSAGRERIGSIVFERMQ